jgi:hypothetical protein
MQVQGQFSGQSVRPNPCNNLLHFSRLAADNSEYSKLNHRKYLALSEFGGQTSIGLGGPSRYDYFPDFFLVPECRTAFFAFLSVFAARLPGWEVLAPFICLS